MSLIRALWDRLRGRAPLDEARVATPSALVVGLGNPGAKYDGTRHNVSFDVVERLAERAGVTFRMDAELEAGVAFAELEGREVLLAQPQTFMNASGRTVEAALERYAALDPESDLLVIFDDMDLPTGRIRLRPSGGGGGHRGIGDILTVLETKAIPRLRFGVGHPGKGGPSVIDWVLAPFPVDETEGLDEAIERAADATLAVLSEGITPAMGRFNA